MSPAALSVFAMSGNVPAVRFTAGEVARATGGALVGDDVAVEGVSIDSRTIEARQLFVPIIGARDGHEFIDPARGPYLTSRSPVGGTAIVVADTGSALLALGRHARSRLVDRVVGITGSVGKTTVKDLTHSILVARYVTAASERSFNNELGVPLTLANARDDAEAIVVEMGARGPGHIALLCDIARPTVGVVTAVGAVHTEVFGTVDDVARGKRELVEALPAIGTAVLNADDARVAAMRDRTDATVVTFGVDASADVTAEDVRLDDELRSSFTLASPWGSVDVRLGVRGVHQIANALAASAAALACGVELDHVVAGLADAVLSPWRMEVDRAPSGALIINDAYNANPLSVAAALRSLAVLDATRRIAFLGTMAELGATAADAHRDAAALAASLGIRVVAVAEPMYGTEVVDSLDAAVALIELGPGDAVLVKGSRVAGLEVLAAALLTR
ncbi:MAG: UDP-N-acetylmuramoyl-tripeptide--D-alanyl-D-alanine ligase [Actinomycetota bacterium]|jgi:UDP-N-acetylmuramoyl-tripeptide--D-alanyl-D-alanine ligase|nr:UDP-N-acetylmuramoyl-tripeptide--D-alanyl-D-alanine ligase [Actinomycetota bacterium]